MIRKATVYDVDAIWGLINPFIANKILLPRDKIQIKKEIDLTWVCDKKSKVVGSINLTSFGSSLYEVRALVVDKNYVGLGIGGVLLMELESHVKKIYSIPIQLFALTYKTGFFLKYGFQISDKSKFPQKVYDVCQYCTRKDDCQEIAVDKLII